MDKKFKQYAVKETGVSVCLPGELKTKVEKERFTIYYSFSKDDAPEESSYILTVEPVNTTLAKKFGNKSKTEIGDKLWKEWEPPSKSKKDGPPSRPAFDLRKLEMTYMAGRHGVIGKWAEQPPPLFHDSRRQATSLDRS